MSIQNTSPLPEASLYRERSSDQRLKSPKRAVPDLDVRVASSLKEVIECWKLVYESYQRIDIVDDNPTGVHTHPHAIRPSTSVVVGRLDKTPVSTLTIMHDCPRYGLPLDRVFNRQLNLLRRLGRPIVEVGLFADRHEVAGRALASIMEMMRFVYWNACFHGADVLCGVHPHHAGFYIKTFGFDLIGPVLPYAAVRGKPVVLLRVSTVNHLRQERLPRAWRCSTRTGFHPPPSTSGSRSVRKPSTARLSATRSATAAC